MNTIVISHSAFFLIILAACSVGVTIGAVVAALLASTKCRVLADDEPITPEHEGHGNTAIFDVLQHDVAEEDCGARVLIADCHCGKRVGLRFAKHATCIIAKDLCASVGTECPNTELKHGDNSP